MKYIVTTTINIPHLLEAYIKDAEEHNHDFHIVVAGDKKTPPAARTFCSALPHVTYLGLEEQKELFGKTPLYRFIPFNSIDRRNFAYLYCFQLGLSPEDTLVTIDDDNFLRQTDFLGHHSQPTCVAEYVTAKIPTWYNPLESFYKEQIFFRGASMYDRPTLNKSKPVTVTNERKNIAINQGLWTGNPDVDALTRMQGMEGDYEVVREHKLMLGTNILAPADTQNTSYLNGFAITAYLPPYVGRFDDILSSFLTKRIADHFDHAIAYGSPVAHQERNVHNTYHDFLLELQGMAFIDTFTSALYNINIPQNCSLTGAYYHLAKNLTNILTFNAPHEGSTNQKTNLWGVSVISQGMILWLETLNDISISTSTSPMKVIANEA